MGLSLTGFKGSGTFASGVHPPGRKNLSADTRIEVMPAPGKVLLPLSQHIGAPSEQVVKPKQTVEFGEVIGKSTGFVSVPVHSPIAGKVMKTAMATMPNGRRLPAVPVKAEGDQLNGQALMDEILGGDWPVDCRSQYKPGEISEAIQKAGIVGLGGAAFPTHVKIMPNDEKPIDALLINGCECEPYLTTDYRLMLEAPGAIITGALLAGHSIGAGDIVIGIEANKPDAIEVMQKAAKGTPIRIAVLKTKYPQGSEKHLIMAIMKRKVPPGALPIDVRAAVSNVGTTAAIARAVLRGKPLTHRVICVTGDGISKPKNLLAAIGTSYRELIETCGGLTQDAAKIISGGPMMGFSFADLDAPVTKGTSGITVLTREDVRKQLETACVRCGRCVDACPLNLVPSRLGLASRNNDPNMAERYNIMVCLECGCCGYICPAGLPLVQLIRKGKAQVMAAGKN